MKLSLNPIMTQKMADLKNSLAPLLITAFSGSVLLLIIRAPFWSSYCEIRAEPHCYRPFIHRLPLVYLRVSCNQHSRVFTEKFLRNQITTHKMASLKNIVKRLRIIFHCYSYSAYHQNDTLMHLLRNCQLTLF